jgi:hypothetical protein
MMPSEYLINFYANVQYQRYSIKKNPLQLCPLLLDGGPNEKGVPEFVVEGVLPNIGADGVDVLPNTTG